MRRLRGWIIRLVGTLRSGAREHELAQELQSHLEHHIEENVRLGMFPEEARRRAILALGGVEQTKAQYRQQRGLPFLEECARNLRYAVRTLCRAPGFTAAAVATLAVGIGASTAIVSVLYGVLLRPLPFEEPGRLVAVHHLAPGFGPAPNGPQSAATYFTYRDHGRVFEDIGLWGADEVTVNQSGEPQRVRALRITGGMLPLLRVHAAVGERIREEDDVPGAPDRVVLTYGYWQRAFAGAEEVIGRPLAIDGAAYEITGVLPSSFRFLDTDPQVVLPLRLDRANAFTGSGFMFRGVARLKPGVELSQANDDIARMIPLVVEQFPLQPGVTREMWEKVGLAPNVRPLAEDVTGDMSRPVWILLGTVAIVLLMACANVANLLLVRTEGRQRELAVRGALGASRSRIARELLSESLVLGLAGGALGVLFAQSGVDVLRMLAPDGLPRVDEIRIDEVALLFTVSISVVAGVLLGLLPVSTAGTFNVTALKDAGRSATDPPGRHRTRNILVVAQIALAVVLLIVSGLMIRTFLAMQRVHPGFVRPMEVQTFRITLPRTLVRDPQQVARTHQQIAERLEQVPGVADVGLASSITMDGSRDAAPIFIEDHPLPGTPLLRRTRLIGPGYFGTMGNPVVAGRAITWADISQLQPVVLISENLAREYWEEPSNALGKWIGGVPGGPWEEIVGIVGNERDAGLNRPAPAIVYRPMAREGFTARSMVYVVRSDRVGAPGFLRELQQAVWSINPNLALASVQTLDEIQTDSMARTSFAMVMLAIAGSVALLLAVVGLYGVVSYVATQRRHEVGLRMALGAQGADVRRLFLRHGLALTLIGLVLGLGAAMLVTPVMASLLFGTGPMDPITYGLVAIGLSAVALVATDLPARRATRVDPITALRAE